MSKHDKTKIEDLNIEDAINLKEKLEKMAAGEDIIISKAAAKQAADLIGTLLTLHAMWTKSKKKINRLLKTIFGNRSERLKDLPKITTDNDDNSEYSDTQNTDIDYSKKNDGNEDTDNNKDGSKKNRKGGGGKNSADDYESAAEITCSLDHDKLPGKICPECGKNKLYEIEPKKVIRLVGNAPVTAFVFILQQVRCLCGAVFTADVGDEFRDIYNEDKYSPSALAAMMIYKYLMGVSFGTLSTIQKMSGVPLPASTQANKIKNSALPAVQAVVGVLKELAANANALGFDDTVIKTIKERLTKKGEKTHRGHGTAIIANDFDNEGSEIVLFDFDSSKHAGDVVCEVLLNRKRESLPLLISDGLNSYDECKKEGIDINCNAHARRKVVEDDPRRETFVGQAVLDCFSEIYKNDSHCKINNLTPKERMNYHNEFSTFYFEKIRAVFNIISGIEDGSVIREIYDIPAYVTEDEPNGDVRSVADYFLKRYDSLTRVTNLPGVPLDTNYVERMIKVIIRIRKNSLFFNNVSSACYSGEILSLLETAVQNEVNVFDYMKFLLANKKEVIRLPRNYLPWNYKLSNREKKSYWKSYEKLIKSPSSSFEPLAEEYFHSSA